MMKLKTLVNGLLVAFLPSAVAGPPVVKEETQEETHVMDQTEQEYGEPNPHAPRELSQFAFLIGEWRCESKIKGVNGVWTTYPATWVGRYILDGYLIADEFRQWEPGGELMQLGQSYRSYNADKRAWVMKWHDALGSTWLDLGPEDLGGVQVKGTTITFKHRVPPGLAAKLFPPHSIFRITYSNISPARFTWRVEVSTDGEKSWDEIQVIEAHRVND